MGQTERALADEIYIMRAARSVAVVVLFVVKTRVQGHDDRERGGSVQADRPAGSRDRLINARKTSQKIRRFSRTRRGERFERARIILHR